MIDIDLTDDDDALPISVIVPLAKKRREFFDEFVLPLIEANNPAEIITNDNEGGAPKKRNDGFKQSTQPYIFFCDDDIVLPKSLLQKMFDALEKNPTKGFAYCGYLGVVTPKAAANHPMHGNFEIPSMPFNAARLRQGNYISTMTLIKRECFPMFDENLKRLQDWDIFLTMASKGIEGVFIPDTKFHAYYLDEGITSNNNNEQDALMAIVRKHNLGT